MRIFGILQLSLEDVQVQSLCAHLGLLANFQS
jgi:hypothetical protein